MKNCSTLYVGIDEHKESLAVAVASSNEPWCRPAIVMPNNVARIAKFLTEQKVQGEVKVVYEAGPGGFVLQRELEKKGFDCRIAAPSLIPRMPGQRKKTDRIDATNLALSYRAGQLTFCTVPTDDQEAARSLVRCRQDISEDCRRTKARILSLLRRNGYKCQA